MARLIGAPESWLDIWAFSTLYAALNTKSGEVIGQTSQRHTSAEFVAFLEDLVGRQAPEQAMHIICDSQYWDTGQNFELSQTARRIGLALTDQRSVNDAVAVEEDRSVRRIGGAVYGRVDDPTLLRSTCTLPFGLLDLQFRMRNKKMPDHGLKSLRMRGNILRVHGRNDAACVSDFGGVSAVSTDDSENGCSKIFRVLECRNQVRADIFFHISSSDRKYHKRITRLEPASL